MAPPGARELRRGTGRPAYARGMLPLLTHQNYVLVNSSAAPGVASNPICGRRNKEAGCLVRPITRQRGECWLYRCREGRASFRSGAGRSPLHAIACTPRAEVHMKALSSPALDAIAAKHLPDASGRDGEAERLQARTAAGPWRTSTCPAARRPRAPQRRRRPRASKTTISAAPPQPACTGKANA